MFHAIHKQLDVLRLPEEFSAFDLHRMVVMLMAEHHDLIFNLEMVQYLCNVYGDLNNKPGPFSIHGYLIAMSKPDFWGDAIVLKAFSKLFNCRITVVNQPDLTSYRFRHNKVLNDMDMVLVYNGLNHYWGTCKYSFSLKVLLISTYVFTDVIHNHICNNILYVSHFLAHKAVR